MRILLAGETWITHSTHIKGVDQFSISSYVSGASSLISALEDGGHLVSHLPAHDVPDRFPVGRALEAYDVVILSDIGANSIQLPTAVFEKSERHVNRMDSLAEWVNGGGGLLMIGGYMSFTGIEGKARYGPTPVGDLLPVSCWPSDDRVECTQGLHPRVVDNKHPIMSGLEETWPHLLGYNRTRLRDGAALLATIDSDPLLAVSDVGMGRSAAFTSDCAPHWAPSAFSEAWPGYSLLFNQIVRWLAKQ